MYGNSETMDVKANIHYPKCVGFKPPIEGIWMFRKRVSTSSRRKHSLSSTERQGKTFPNTPYFALDDLMRYRISMYETVHMDFISKFV